MNVSVSEAKGQLLELVRRVEAGEDVVLTRHGKAVVRLTAIGGRTAPAKRRALLDEIRRSAKRHAQPGTTAARSQDFLYGDSGLPE